MTRDHQSWTFLIWKASKEVASLKFNNNNNNKASAAPKLTRVVDLSPNVRLRSNELLIWHINHVNELLLLLLYTLSLDLGEVFLYLIKSQKLFAPPGVLTPSRTHRSLQRGSSGTLGLEFWNVGTLPVFECNSSDMLLKGGDYLFQGQALVWWSGLKPCKYGATCRKNIFSDLMRWVKAWAHLRHVHMKIQPGLTGKISPNRDANKSSQEPWSCCNVLSVDPHFTEVWVNDANLHLMLTSVMKDKRQLMNESWSQ